MAKTVVILGGAFAGVQVAHRLLKYTLPHVKDLKVILVSKNSHFYWNLAAVRAIVPGVLKEEQYALPIAPGFAKYSEDVFEFVVGTAEAVVPENKVVKVSVGWGPNREERELSYDYLVVATGTRTAGATNVPWKNNGTHEDIAALLAETQQKVKAAKHIVVAGAGATGVETAAELGFEYGNPKDGAAKKEIILLSAHKGGAGRRQHRRQCSVRAQEAQRYRARGGTGREPAGPADAGADDEDLERHSATSYRLPFFAVGLGAYSCVGYDTFSSVSSLINPTHPARQRSMCDICLGS
ncbi:hypothetical protein NUW58_g2162 [Xylaria curta]|uniref:Uncharacterized protein n=1 Tax=Xylaria curta TaxID=42375 RepID=A0ACC1PGX5_9PEZI|nr:hypothetical protein NUW58_g2162 [Xylaria curta]